jgi:disulfide bond formation protein DsbB
VPLGLLIAVAAATRAPRAVLIVGFALVAALFVYNTGLAIYHSGVEAKLWEGPTACTGGYSGGQGDLLTQLQTVKVVRCDEVSLRVFGLSLANWNIAISAALAGLAVASGWRR